MKYEVSVNGNESAGAATGKLQAAATGQLQAAGVSLSEAFAQWSANQSSTWNDRGYWKHYKRCVWVPLDVSKQRESHHRDGRPDPSYAAIENLSLKVRVPLIMEDTVMDGLQALITEKLRVKWPEVEHVVWPDVMESLVVE